MKDFYQSYGSPDDDDLREFTQMSPIYRNLIKAASIGFLVPLAVLIVVVMILEGVI